MMIFTTMQTNDKRYLKSALTAFSVLLFWVLFWQILAILINEPLFLPTPLAVLSAMSRIFAEGSAYLTALASLIRILTGFFEGVLLGILLAILTELIPPVKALLSPILSVVRSTPVASFIMLLWLVLGNKNLPIVIALLMVVPLIHGNVSAGIRNVSSELNEVCTVYELPLKKRFLFHIYPSVMPYFAPAFVNALGLAWKAGIAAEVLANTPLSIGREIYFSKSYLEVEELYAWTLCVIFLSLILEFIVKKIFRKWTKGEVKIV